jgi:hypothetical protein
MKRALAVLVVCGLAGIALALNVPTGQEPAAKAPPSTQPSDGRLVVHEWGTFTGFAGSDGVHLPFGIAVGSELPPFVINRKEQARRQGVKFNPWGDLSKGGGVFALQRMETPVVYFYTDRPRDVSASVNFPQGLLTEFYPPVRAMGPAFGDGPGEYRYIERAPIPADAPPATRPAPRFGRGSLDWGTVRIVPQAAGEPAVCLPDVPQTAAAGGHYRYARETDAATVQFSDRPGEQHNERFLFYRGLGDFTLPVTLTAGGGDRFEMTNLGEQPIRFALLLRVADGRARFALYRDVTGKQAMALPAETVALDEIGDAIAAALVAEGLYEKEARAMVKTWSSNWLGEPGARVLYTVPRAVTDGLLPLRITPTPDQTVRVLVGRIDVMTPEEEAKIQSLLATSPEITALSPDDAAYLRGLGRFFDPAIDRAAKLRGSPDDRKEINRLRSLYFSAPTPTPSAPVPTPGTAGEGSL